MHTINIRVGGGRPFLYQVASRDSLRDLRKYLFSLNPHVLSANMAVRSITGALIQVTNEAQYVVDALEDNEGAAIQFLVPATQNMLSQTMEPSPTTHQTISAKSPSQGLMAPTQEFYSQPPHFTGPRNQKDIRLADLAIRQLLELFELNKIGFGRWIDESNKTQVSERNMFDYGSIIRENPRKLVQNLVSGYCRRSDDLTEYEKELVKQGVRPREFAEKVPFGETLSFEDPKRQSKYWLQASRERYSCVQHFFPVGGLQLDLYELQPMEPPIQSYFQGEASYSCASIKRFYRRYGQYFIRRCVMGIKHVAEFKHNTTLEKRINGRISSEPKGFSGSNLLNANWQYINSVVEEVTVFGSSNTELFDIGVLTQSISQWRHWRIIEIKEYESVHTLLSEGVRRRVEWELAKASYIHNATLSQARLRETGILDSFPKPKDVEAVSRVVCTFSPDTLQIVPIIQYSMLLLVQKQRIDWVKIDSSIDLGQLPIPKLKDVIGCAVDSQGKAFYIIEKKRILAYSLPNFQELSQAALVFNSKMIWRCHTVVESGKLLACGSNGLYSISVSTGELTVLLKDDYSGYEIIKLQNRVFLFGKDVKFIDLVSHCSCTIEPHSWNEGHPTSNGLEIWKCSNGVLYQICGSDIYQLTIMTESMRLGKFPQKSPVCYMNGSLYLPNENFTYLIRHQLKDGEIMKAVAQYAQRKQQNLPIHGEGNGPASLVRTAPTEKIYSSPQLAPSQLFGATPQKSISTQESITPTQMSMPIGSQLPSHPNSYSTLIEPAIGDRSNRGIRI